MGQGDHLHVEVGVGHAERLDPELVVLAIAPLLRALVAEQWRHVPGLPRRHRVVLDEGPGHRGRPLRAQRHQLTVAVLEDVHLLAHDLALLSDAAVEDGVVLDDRREGQAISCPLDQPGEADDRVLPTHRLGPQDVVHPRGRALGGRPLRRGRTRGHHILLTCAQTFLPGS
jgi:hypothetical protein